MDSFINAFSSREDVSMLRKQRLATRFRSATPELFTLNFNEYESYYTFNQPLASDTRGNIGSKASKSPYYCNKKDNTIIEMSLYLGNIAHKPLNWRITKETKKIGDYTCYKAIASERLYSRRGYFYNRQVIAWFAPSIALNFGPSNYNGLPGLILEVKRDKFTLQAKEINLNPKKEIKIVRPKKNAKIIDQEESFKRIAEQMEAYNKN